MSHLHFVASSVYKKRVIQLGEQPSKVFKVGAAGLDNINNFNYWSRDEIEASLNINLKQKIFLITYHPLTLKKEAVDKVDELLISLSNFPNVSLIFTGSNADPSGRMISEKIIKFCKLRSETAKYFSNLGVDRYLSLMKLASVVIGNSSSGIIEAPSIGTPTVNIGDRQRGRLQAKSIVNADEDHISISAAIEFALSHYTPQNLHDLKSPYGGPGAAAAIEHVISSIDLSDILIKKFHDI
jgi:UDP-N-acetylglucosamine 2-epimerase (non-hydrolysing)/GDP/UDP-N,N'-diacetylbacillosamine 2-epimerase (hydrolysing)